MTYEIKAPVTTWIARVQGKPGRQTITTQPTIADENVRPFKLSSLEGEPYVLKKGFPYVPPVWVKAEPLVSAQGLYQLLNRPHPLEVDFEGSRARFVGISETWDSIAGKWTPVSSEGINYYWTSVEGAEPSIDTVTYRLGKEMFTHSALRFLSGDYLISSFNQGIDDATDYTIAMVASMDVPTGFQLLSQGADKATGVGVYVGEDFDFSYGGVHAGVDTALHPAQMIPVYIILSVGAPRATLWIGTAPNKMKKMQVQSSKMGSMPMQFTLGKNWEGLANATMYIMDMALFPHEATMWKDPDTNYPSILQIMNTYTNIYGAW